MTTTTLTDILAGSVSLVTFVGIEGYQNMLTDADASTAAVQTVASNAGYAGALGGLSVTWSLDQRLHPWEPFNSSSSSVTLRFMDSGTGSPTSDAFGLAVFKREGQTVSPLYEDVNPGDAVVKVKRSSAFGGSGNIHIGCETIAYTGNDNGTNPGTFSTLTRGMYTPFKHDDGGGFQRTHRKTPTVPNIPAPDVEAGTSALVSSAQLDWRGRWVGVWLTRKRGETYDSIAQSHLAFAGRISNVVDSEDGSTIVQVDEVRQVIADAVIMREQWRAKVKDGVTLRTGMRFTLKDKRQYVSGGVPHVDAGTANALAVVASGAASVNEINAGLIDGEALATAINDWMASELAAARVLFRHTFVYAALDQQNTSRSSLFFSDDSVTASGVRGTQLSCTGVPVRAFFGWSNTDEGGIGAVSDGSAYSGTGYSENEPQRAVVELNQGATTTLEIEDAQGSFAVQTALLNPWLAQWPTNATGVVRVGTAYLACTTPSSTQITVSGAPMNRPIGLDEDPNWFSVPVSGDGAVEIVQVLVLDGYFSAIVLSLLASTGGGLNWTAYDVLPEHCSAAIPYDLLTTSLEVELQACPGDNLNMTVIVDRPTRLPDLLGADFTTRLLQFVWRQGRLALRGYATPTSAATLTIAADTRSAPMGTEDDMRAVTVESDSLMRNVIKIRHNADAGGENFRDTITIEDPGSASNFGPRVLTINARNANRGRRSGQDLNAILPDFIAGLIFLGRPQMTIRVPLDHTMIEQATPGEVCLFTDGFARDPATGTRGITSRPALVLAQNASWGGIDEPARCEVDLMIFPRLSLAAYSPCAQVDDTAANAGYNAGTKVLTCYAHEHSESSAAADASLFGDSTPAKVRIVEIDPATAAAPLTWDDTVASQSGNTITLTTGLAGWDNTKKYRVISDTYGDATTTQRAKCYQADDADGQVVDARAPYAMSFSPTGQATTFTSSAATELPERPPDLAYGDGAALDTGHARALARGVNNLISYKTAPQHPGVYNEAMTWSGSGTWTLVWCEPVPIGVGLSTGALTRYLYVAPRITKAGAASADVRVTLARRPPRAANASSLSRDDVIRVEPYSTTTFTTTSATYETPTPVALAIDHLQLTPSHIGGGIGWLYVECQNHASFKGFGVKYVGPLVAP